MAEIIIKNLRKTYKSLLFSKNETKVFNNLNLEIPMNKLTAITGRNGSGKTTLFKILASHIGYDEGSITIFGKTLKEYSQNNRIFLILPENRSMYYRLTVKQNLEFFTKVMKVKVNSKEIKDLLNFFEIYNLKDKKFHQLSTGQKQRAILIRGLILKPDILIIDEPEIGLDKEITVKLFDKLKNLRKETTIIYSSHVPEIIKKADKIIKLN